MADKSRKKVFWPWQTDKWARIKGILESKIENMEQFEKAVSDILGENFELVFFKRYFTDFPLKKEAFFSTTLPFIQKMALRLPSKIEEMDGLSILLAESEEKVVLDKETVVGILSHAFFLTIDTVEPVRFTGASFNDFTLSTFYRSYWHVAAMECLLHYFERVCQSMPKGKLSVWRQVLKASPDYASSTKPLCKVEVSSKGTIEDSNAEFHADFANMYIGGGVLHGGCVQEEILFLIKPECLVTLLFCAKMEENETIIIRGAERFSNYSGYARNFQFAGDHEDKSPRDEGESIKTKIIAMDAIVAGSSSDTRQFQKPLFRRDLNKAYCGFRSTSEMGSIATGNWGCGAFGGDKRLKAFQQILAASEAECPTVLYFTFKDEKLEQELQGFVKDLQEAKATVGQLYSCYINNTNYLEDSIYNTFNFVRKYLKP